MLSNSIAFKCFAAGKRMEDVFRYWPRRVKHLLRHTEAAFQQIKDAGRLSGRFRYLLQWLLDFPLLLLDCVGVAEVYETAADVIKFNSRPLSKRERSLARLVFGTSICLSRVRLDKYAWLGPRQARFCYVSFFHINCWGSISDDLLIHELMHVWQYQHLGICYIPRALQAQWSKAGYDYGGVEELRAALRTGKGLLDFNYEQQADIVADYFRLREGKRPRWGGAGPAELSIYQPFIDEIETYPLPN